MGFESIVSGEGTFQEFGFGLRFKEVADRIQCCDGVSLSVQAGKHLYCTPRSDYGPYTAVEVGFPSASPPESWRGYFDGDWDTEDHCSSVYSRVPVEMVREFIEAHGGEK